MKERKEKALEPQAWEVKGQTTSYLMLRRLLSTESSSTSWGKRTISLSWTPCEDRAEKFSSRLLPPPA